MGRTVLCGRVGLTRRQYGEVSTRYTTTGINKAVFRVMSYLPTRIRRRVARRLISVLPDHLILAVTSNPMQVASDLVTASKPEKALRVLFKESQKDFALPRILEIDHECINSESCEKRDILILSKLIDLIGQISINLPLAIRLFYSLGACQIAGMLRAIYLILEAGKNVNNNLLLFEISENDYCSLALQIKTKNIPSRVLILSKIEEFRKLKLSSKLEMLQVEGANIRDSLFLKDSEFLLQGPSERESDLSADKSVINCAVGYTGPSSLVNSLERVDISFYRPFRLKMLEKVEGKTVISELGKAAVLQGVLERNSRFLVDKKCGKVIQSDVIRHFNGSELNSGTEALVWLALRSPQSLLVRNIDLFLNNTYPEGYEAKNTEKYVASDGGGTRENTQLSTCRFFGLHKPCQQFLIYRCFMKDPAVDYDSVLHNICSSSLSEYLKQLEASHRVWNSMDFISGRSRDYG